MPPVPMRLPLGVLAFASILAAQVPAAPGDLDTTFATGGIATLADAALQRLAVQDDGKVVVAGVAYGSEDRDILVARFETDGTLDEDFGTGGVAIVAVDADYDDYLGDIAVDSPGRIVVVGHTDLGYGNAWFLRLETDGSLDTDLDGDGIVHFEPGPAGGTAERVALLDDGRILIGCRGAVIFASGYPVLRAFAADGSFSYTLAGETYMIFGSYSSFKALAVQSDGGIISAFQSGDDNMYVTRLDTDGSIDTDFGTAGTATIEWTSDCDIGDIAIDAQDQIVIAGDGDGRRVVVRLLAAGLLDLTFGTLGTTYADDDASELRDVAIGSDGEIVVVADMGVGNVADFYVARFDDMGSLDAEFGASGGVELDTGNQDIVAGVALQSDGKILVTGAGVGSEVYGTVARFLADGSNPTLLAIRNVHRKNQSDELSAIPDLGSGGLEIVGSLGDAYTAVKALAVSSDDRIFAAEGGRLLDIDPATGAASVIGSIGFPDVTGLAFHPTSGLLYGVTYGSNKLLTIDTDTGAGTVVASRVLNSSRLNDLAFHPDGDLYVVTAGTQARLFEISATTGKKIQRWNLTGATGLESLLWSEDGETLYSAAVRGGYKDLCTIDLDSSTVSFVSSTSSGMRDIEGLGWYHGEDLGASKPLAAGAEPEDEVDPDELADPESGLDEDGLEATGPRLLGNHPNPFNPTTRIDYALPAAGVVHLAVYDVAGRHVATLVSGAVEAGVHAVTWDGRTSRGERAASGVYCCVLRTDGEAATRRMVLLE